MSAKESVRELLDQLPDDVDWEQLREKIDLLAAIDEAEKQADAGLMISHEEMEREIARWKNSK